MNLHFYLRIQMISNIYQQNGIVYLEILFPFLLVSQLSVEKYRLDNHNCKFNHLVRVNKHNGNIT